MTEKNEKTVKTESEDAHELAAQAAQEGIADMAQAAETLEAARDAAGVIAGKFGKVDHDQVSGPGEEGGRKFVRLRQAALEFGLIVPGKEPAAFGIVPYAEGREPSRKEVAGDHFNIHGRHHGAVHGGASLNPGFAIDVTDFKGPAAEQRASPLDGLSGRMDH